MNSSTTKTDVFLEALRKSALIPTGVLDSFLEEATAAGEITESPIELAKKMIVQGHLTRFQTEQLLQGRWRNFSLAGKYKILERISSGQMSSVFLCEHITMKRLVALKMLPSDKAKDPASLSRFHREARAAARLRHPNVVAIHDLDSANGLHFLVAEYVDGHDLDRVVAATGPMSIARTADYIRQAAEGLQHAHEMGMVHRDIKPGNLLLDRSGTVKLLDLGLARLFLDESDGMTKLDDGRMLLGTIDYLSPEQAVDSHAVDIRADIYSLGATAFFLLSGRTLFEGSSTVQKLAMHGHRPAEQIIRELSGIPRGFADVLVKMLEKDPVDRYRTPAEVAEAMAPWTADNVPLPSAAEMPKLCIATRRVVEQTRSKTVRVPLRTSTPPPSKQKSSTIAKVSNVLTRRQISRPRNLKSRLPWAIGLGAAGMLGLVVIIALSWGGSSGTTSASEPIPQPQLPVASLAPATPQPSFSPEPASPVAGPSPLTQEQQDEMYTRANELAAANRGVEAGELLRKLIDLKQQGAWSWQRLALLDLHGNNLEKHRQDCLEMLRRFGNTNDSADAERVVKSCMISTVPIELEQVSALAERLLAPSSGEFAFWNKSVMGLVAIRRGAYEEALAYLTEADHLNTANQPQARCLNKAFLSILHSRRKQPKLAKASFDEATALMKAETEKEGRVDYSYEWHNWYSCEIALKEAANLLRFPPK